MERVGRRGRQGAFKEGRGAMEEREGERQTERERLPRVLLSEALAQTYARCNPLFRWDGAKPRRCLTKGGANNTRQDLVLFVGDVLRGGGTRATYTVEDLLGSGTFGQVVRCRREVEGMNPDVVAVKIVRNKPAYSKQGLIEIGIVEHLNKADCDDKHHVVRMHDYFVCKGHVCIVFELLSVNLYELLKSNNYRGLSTTLVRVFVAQLLDACMLLRRNNILHCDLKPENILLASAAHPLIKVIDFGSACYENHTSFSYIQSRFYRAPEVLLGLPYGPDIDMWSCGCIVAELYLGLPLFAGTSELAQLRLISDCLGPFPSHMLLAGSKVRRFFHVDGLSFTLKTDLEFATENNVALRKPNRRYFEFSSLEELVLKYPGPCSASERPTRLALAHLLSGLLCLDPVQRWTPAQAARHPFLTGEPWDESWRPPRRAFGAMFDDPSQSPSPLSTPRTSRQLELRTAVGESPPRRVPSLPFPEVAATPTSRPAESNSGSNSESEDEWEVGTPIGAGMPRSRAISIPQQQQQLQRRSKGKKQLQPALGYTPSDRHKSEKK